MVLCAEAPPNPITGVHGRHLREKSYNDLLRWCITCRHHVLLADVLRTEPELLAALRSFRPTQDLCSQADHPSVWAVRSQCFLTTELVAANAGVHQQAITQAARLGSLEILEVLLHYFIDQTQGVLPSDELLAGQQHTDKEKVPIDWKQMEEALGKGNLHVKELLLRAGTSHSMLAVSPCTSLITLLTMK